VVGAISVGIVAVGSIWGRHSRWVKMEKPITRAKRTTEINTKSPYCHYSNEGQKEPVKS